MKAESGRYGVTQQRLATSGGQKKLAYAMNQLKRLAYISSVMALFKCDLLGETVLVTLLKLHLPVHTHALCLFLSV